MKIIPKGLSTYYLSYTDLTFSFVVYAFIFYNFYVVEELLPIAVCFIYNELLVRENPECVTLLSDVFIFLSQTA